MLTSSTRGGKREGVCMCMHIHVCTCLCVCVHACVHVLEGVSMEWFSSKLKTETQSFRVIFIFIYFHLESQERKLNIDKSQ